MPKTVGNGRVIRTITENSSARTRLDNGPQNETHAAPHLWRMLEAMIGTCPHAMPNRKSAMMDVGPMTFMGFSVMNPSRSPVSSPSFNAA